MQRACLWEEECLLVNTTLYSRDSHGELQVFEIAGATTKVN